MVHNFRVTRLTVDADGHTRFVDEDLAFDRQLLAPPAEPASLAFLGEAELVAVMRVDRDWGGEAFHPAPRRQLLTVLAGA